MHQLAFQPMNSSDLDGLISKRCLKRLCGMRSNRCTTGTVSCGRVIVSCLHYQCRGTKKKAWLRSFRRSQVVVPRIVCDRLEHTLFYSIAIASKTMHVEVGPCSSAFILHRTVKLLATTGCMSQPFRTHTYTCCRTANGIV